MYGGTASEIQILSAVYGKREVTAKIKSEFLLGQRTFYASNEILTDGWYGVQKTLVIVYSQNGDIKTKVCAEGESISL